LALELELSAGFATFVFAFRFVGFGFVGFVRLVEFVMAMVFVGFVGFVEYKPTSDSWMLFVIPGV
jgi:hypothetical protein